MKRFTSILLALAMILTLLPMGVFAADNTPFSDVKGNEYFSAAASALEELGILAGYPDGTFGAEKSITRAEMAAIVCRMIDKETEAEKAEGKTNFDDVEASHWASGYINIASKEGIINGDGNGKFRPEDDVKYEEAIKMVVCALGFGDDVAQFSVKSGSMSFANYSVILKAQKIGTAEIPFSEHLEPKEDSVKNRNYASIGIIPNTLDIRTISVQKSSILGSVIASAITKGFRANCPLAFIRPLQGVCLCVPLTLCDIFQYISEHTGT